MSSDSGSDSGSSSSYSGYDEAGYKHTYLLVQFESIASLMIILTQAVSGGQHQL
jgi:hypothetical protein